MAANTKTGPIMPSRLRCHCRWLSQSMAFAMKASTAKSGSSRLMNIPPLLDQKAQPDGGAETGAGWKAGRAAHRRNDAAEYPSLVGNACHQSRDAAPEFGSADQRLTLDG